MGARIAEDRRLAEEMEEVRQELYLEEEAERERLRQLAELEKRQRQREELVREQEEMKIQRQLRMQAERDQEEAYKHQVDNHGCRSSLKLGGPIASAEVVEAPQAPSGQDAKGVEG